MGLLIEYEWQIEDALAGKLHPDELNAELRATLERLDLSDEEVEEVALVVAAQTQLPEEALAAWLGGKSWR